MEKSDLGIGNLHISPQGFQILLVPLVVGFELFLVPADPLRHIFQLFPSNLMLVSNVVGSLGRNNLDTQTCSCTGEVLMWVCLTVKVLVVFCDAVLMKFGDAVLMKFGQWNEDLAKMSISAILVQNTQFDLQSTVFCHDRIVVHKVWWSSTTINNLRILQGLGRKWSGNLVFALFENELDVPYNAAVWGNLNIARADHVNLVKVNLDPHPIFQRF